MTNELFALVPGDSIPGPDNRVYPKPLMLTVPRVSVPSPRTAAVPTRLGPGCATSTAWRRTIRLGLPNSSTDCPGRRGILGGYLVERDTTLLARYIGLIDTTGSRTWKAMVAHLELARGDTASALARYDQNFVRRDDTELRNDFGCARLFAWADLQARVGNARAASDAYALFDTEASGIKCPALHVRSWAERGALYQQLGDSAKAIENYDRFIRAWANADAILQPQVDRARKAVAALRGETAPVEGQ